MAAASVDADPAEFGQRPRRYGQHQAGGMRLVVDFDPLLANFREGETFLAQRDLQGGPGVNHILSDDRVARFEPRTLCEAEASCAPPRPARAARRKRRCIAGQAPRRE